MPSTYVSTFGSNYVWHWDDTPEDDPALIEFLRRFSWLSSGDYEVDRSGVGPVLRWQKYVNQNGAWVPSGNWRENPLNVGDYVLPRGGGGSNLYEPVVGPLPGYWESDNSGRPYDLNDLVAPLPPPTP